MSDPIYKAMIVEPGEIVEMVPGDRPPNPELTMVLKMLIDKNTAEHNCEMCGCVPKRRRWCCRGCSGMFCDDCVTTVENGEVMCLKCVDI